MPEEARGFIGERYDSDAGLQFLNARYYDPDLGLFLQPDWFEVTRRGVDTNRYAYSFNDPVNLRDPSGHEVYDDSVSDENKGRLKSYFQRLRNKLRGHLNSARSLRDRLSRNGGTGSGRVFWPAGERRLYNALQRTASESEIVDANMVESHIGRTEALLDGIGEEGSGIAVRYEEFYAEDVAATAHLNSNEVVIYGVIFERRNSDARRTGYLLHEAGHAVLGLPDAIGSSGDPGLAGVTFDQDVMPHPKDASQILGYRGRGADLATSLGWKSTTTASIVHLTSMGVGDEKTALASVGFYRCFVRESRFS